MEHTNRESVMSVKDWVITMIILSIPMVNLIMILVWAFSDETNKNKQNLMKAYLIVFAVIMSVIILFGALGAVATGLLS